MREPSTSASSSSSTSGTSSSIISALAQGFSGSIGASLSNVATYPLDLIITRLQIQRQLQKQKSTRSSTKNDGEKDGDGNGSMPAYRGVRDAAEKIYENEGGIWGFYTGGVEDTVKTVADSFLFFLLYSFLRERRLRKLGGEGKGELRALEELAVGFAAGAVTKLATTPVANVVTRAQTEAMVESSGGDGGKKKKGKGSMAIAQEILDEKGIPGFWSGYSASLILTLNPSLTFMMFEMLKRVTLPRGKRERPPAAVTFLLSALSKMVASSVTYPFSLAKSRLQVGGKREDKEEKEEVERNIGADTMRARVLEGTIFGTIVAIVEQEGWRSLYEGLSLEITKGFFSHGITMAVKQGIQRLLVKLWYVSGIVFGRYRRKLSGKRLQVRARENVEYYNLGMARAAEAIESVAMGAKERARETAEFVGEYVEEDSEQWRELYGTTGLAKWLQGDRTEPE